MEWEELDERIHYRTPILGGWLFKAYSTALDAPVGICFIPDPEHEWDGKSIDLEEKRSQAEANAKAIQEWLK